MNRSRILYFIVLTIFAWPAQAQQMPAPLGNGAILTVRGMGHFETKPDYASLHVTVSTKASTLAEAARLHGAEATRALAVLQELKSDGVEVERSTFELDRDPPRPSSPGVQASDAKPPPPPFTARTVFSLKTKAIDALNAVVTKLASSGLFEVFSVHFGLERERAALNEARRQAISDARDQAAVYADAAGLQLLEIVAITDGEAARVLAEAAAYRVTQLVQIIPPRTVAFDSAVHVTWRIAPR